MIITQAVAFTICSRMGGINGNPVGSFEMRVQFDGAIHPDLGHVLHISTEEWGAAGKAEKDNIMDSLWANAEGLARSALNRNGLDADISWYGNIYKISVHRFMDKMLEDEK